MFGRRKDDEDPFAALKDGGTYQSQPTTVPDVGAGGLPGQSSQSVTAPSVSASPGIAAPPPALPALPAPPATPLGSLPALRPRQSRRYGGSGRGPMILLRLAIPAVVIAAIAIPAINMRHSIHSFSVPSFSTPSSIPATPTPAPARSVSYLTPRGVRAGLARISKLAPGARLTLLRVDGHSLSAIATLHGRGAKLIYFGPTGTTVTGTASPGQDPIALSQIRPNVVGRLMAAMHARFHVPASRIDYMVISSPPGLSPHWIIFSKAPARHGYSAALGGANPAQLPG